MSRFLRGEVWDVQLDPTVGSELQKRRPCIIVSPDILNVRLRTVTIVPLASNLKSRPYHIPVQFQGRDGVAVLEQVRTVDRLRLGRFRGDLDPGLLPPVLLGLQEFFSL